MYIMSKLDIFDQRIYYYVSKPSPILVQKSVQQLRAITIPYKLFFCCTKSVKGPFEVKALI